MDVRGTAMFDSIIPEKIEILVPFKFKILDYYVNGHTRGLDGCMHTDDADYTFLVFCNPVWDLMWVARLCLYRMMVDLMLYSLNRSAVFSHQYMHHCAEDTSREFYGIRVSAAYKLKKLEDKNAEPTDI